MAGLGKGVVLFHAASRESSICAGARFYSHPPTQILLMGGHFVTLAEHTHGVWSSEGGQHAIFTHFPKEHVTAFTSAFPQYSRWLLRPSTPIAKTRGLMSPFVSVIGPCRCHYVFRFYHTAAAYRHLITYRFFSTRLSTSQAHAFTLSFTLLTTERSTILTTFGLR